MLKKLYIFIIALNFLFPQITYSAPTIPFRIAGTVTVDGVQLTANTDDGYIFKVIRENGTVFDPSAEDADGLTNMNFYIIDIPIYNADSVPGGANPGETAIIQVSKNGNTLPLIQPANGEITVGLQGDILQINLIIITNMPPAADAGADQTVEEGETVTLNGTNSLDPDDGIASYLWDQISGPVVILSDETDAQPTFLTVPVDVNGASLRFQLTVTDNGGLQSSDEIDVFIEDNGIGIFPNNVLPTITFSGEQIGIRTENGGKCIYLNFFDASLVSNSTNRPGNLLYGLADIYFKTDVAGGTVTFTLFLPESAPENYKWFKYSDRNGWTDYSSKIVFNNDRDQITITITDGGAGDDDGVVNGIIIDPSGLGYISASSGGTGNTGTGDTPSGGGGSGGVFGVINIDDVIGYHFDWITKEGIKVYMPVTKYFKALKGAQTHIETYAPDIANFIRGTFDALERKADFNKDGLLQKIGTYIFPILGRIAEIYLDIAGSKDLMTNAYIKTTISEEEYNKMNKEGAATSSKVVRMDTK